MCFAQHVCCQQTLIDSLSIEEFSVLEEKFNENSLDSSRIKYADAFLLKAKRNKNVIKIADGYLLFSEYYSKTNKAIQYADSILFFTENWHQKKYPAQGYIQKGIELYYNSNHAKALESFIKANALASKQRNNLQLITVKHYIGLLKNISDEREEALILFKENFKNIQQKNLQNIDRKQYLKSLYALADSYSKNLNFDTARVLLKKGVIESNNKRDGYIYPHFLVGYGINSYHIKKYQIALDSLHKAIILLKNEEQSLPVIYLYLYDIYTDLNNQKTGLKYLFKIDTLYQTKSSSIYNARESYFLLSNYFKSINNSRKQLEYLNKFLVTDSIIDHDFGKLNKQITNKYETPLLLQQKQKLISSLKQNSKEHYRIITLLIILSLAFLLIILYVLRRNYKNKERFKTILEYYQLKKQITNKTRRNNVIKVTSQELSEELVNEILIKLDDFESSKSFITKKYTLNSLSKELKTNSTYLSKVINITKGMNFSNYLNNLKIEYVLDKLTNDEQFRQVYNIKGIAKKCGFSNTQSFSTAFYKKTGLHPSYFIKKLNKETK